jgi:hypothetical protein
MKANKIILLRILFLLNLLNVHSQNLPKSKVEINWSKEYDFNESKERLSIIGKDDNFFYATEKIFEGFSETMNLLKYNNDFKEFSKMEICREEKKMQKKLYRVFLNKYSNIYSISSTYDSKQKIKSFFVESIDKNSLKPNPSLTKIVDMTDQKETNSLSGFLLHKLNNEYFDLFHRSPDSSKYATIILNMSETIKKEKFYIKVFDDNMKTLWDKMVTLPFDDELYQIVEAKVSNDGDLYIIGKIYDNKAVDEKKGKSNYKFQILRFEKAKENPDIIELGTDGKFISSLTLSFTPNKDLDIHGFYSTKEQKDIQGTFYTNVDLKTNKLKNQNYQKLIFQGNNINDIKKESNKEENEGHGDLNLIRTLKRDNGNTILIGEIRGIFTDIHTKIGNNNASYPVYQLDYLEIYVICLEPNGNIVWIKQIRKHQKGKSELMSIGVLGNDKIHILFNDDIDNTFINRYSDKAKIRTYNGEKNTALVMVSIDDKGNYSETEIFNNKNEKFNAWPLFLFKANPQKFIMLCNSMKKLKIATIKFKESSE